MPNYTAKPEENQGVKSAKTKKISDFQTIANGKKVQSRIMARYLDQVGLHQQANLMYTCGDTLLVRKYPDDHVDVAAALYCHQRLCPTCQWRRARKASGQLSGVMDALDDARRQSAGAPYSYIALTYSPRNILDIADMEDQITRLALSFRRLTRCREVQRAVPGAIRCIEIRRSDGKYNPAYKGSWQVHIHSILCVLPGYYHSRDYLSREAWGRLLAQCLDITYIPEFYVHRVDGATARAGAPAETAKYITKFDEPFNPSRPDDLNALVHIWHAIRGRHMIQYYGIMRDMYRKLYHDDPEAPDADLTDVQPTRPDLDYILMALRYGFGVGYQLTPIDSRRDRLLISQLSVPAADGITGELIVPEQLRRSDQKWEYAMQPLRGNLVLHSRGE